MFTHRLRLMCIQDANLDGLASQECGTCLNGWLWPLGRPGTVHRSSCFTSRPDYDISFRIILTDNQQWILLNWVMNRYVQHEPEAQGRADEATG